MRYYSLLEVPSQGMKKSELRRRPKIAAAVLDQLIAEATVDCYNESEQRSGFCTMLEENLGLPFETNVLGVQVMVERIDLTDAEEIVAICTRGHVQQAIPILELPLPVPLPRGAEWIEAYRRWACGG
jgi:Calcium binding